MELRDKSSSRNISSIVFDWKCINLSKYTNTWYKQGRSKYVISCWRYFGLPLLRHLPCEAAFNSFFNFMKIALLRLFGAKIGNNCVIRSCDVHMPWNLEVGDNVWLGYDSTLYNLVPIKIGNNVCISQKAFLCTGSHDITEPGFGLIVGEITVKDASWVCASCFIGPGVTIHEGAVAAAGSVVTKDIPPMMIYGGNPCKPIAPRIIRGQSEAI